MLPERENLERQTGFVYETYFGPDWKKLLFEHLLTSVKQATPEDWKREGDIIAHVSTTAVLDPKTMFLMGQQITVYTDPNDFYLRHELGEALWNVLQFTALQDETKPFRVYQKGETLLPVGVGKLLQQGYPGATIIDYCRRVLDSWGEGYQIRLDEYHVMRPDRLREYGDIPEWKSEGFADAVAVDVRRRSGLPVDDSEQGIWESLGGMGDEIVVPCVGYFLPPIIEY
jgi:hypothetical protein